MNIKYIEFVLASGLMLINTSCGPSPAGGEGTLNIIRRGRTRNPFRELRAGCITRKEGSGKNCECHRARRSQYKIRTKGVGG